MKSAIACILFAIVCTYVTFNREQMQKEIIYQYDKTGYYNYLPAYFIHKDLQHFAFLPHYAHMYNFGGQGFYGMHEMPDGKRVNKYPVGVSLFELPTFLIAHAYCKKSTVHGPDGYSDPYEYGIIFATILWSFLGLLVLRKFLLRHFSDTVTMIVLLCVGFGTNFYTYTAFDQGMSHTFSLFLFSALLLHTDKWHANPRPISIYMIGLVMGAIFITRPVNIIAGIVPLAWGLENWNGIGERLKLFISKARDVLIAVVLFVAVAGIQLYYWKFATGHWLFFSYKGEEFNFMEPQIINGLFSFRKGWFVYTPIALIGMTGLFYTPKKYVPCLVAFFAIMIYVVFSWENWYYGGGFGARPLIETMAVVALPLGFLTKKLLSKKSVFVKSSYLFALLLLISLNMFQSFQYRENIIHWDRMTFAYYWRVFGTIKPKDEDQKLLISDQKYYSEIYHWNTK